jgi:hypothetical protein
MMMLPDYGQGIGAESISHLNLDKVKWAIPLCFTS